MITASIFDGFEISVPLNFLERVSLSYSLLSFPGEDTFQGGIVWFKEWNIGPSYIERAGWKVVEQMRRGYGQIASLENAPGQRFRRDEFVDAQAFLLQAMSFEWDVFFVPALADHYIFVSHTQVAYCVAHDAKLLGELCSYLNPWGPRNDLPFFLQSR